MVREQGLDVGARAASQHIGFFHQQRVAFNAALAAFDAAAMQPFLERGDGVHVRRNARIVKREPLLLIGQQVRPAQTDFLFAQRFDQGEVLLQELRLVRQIAAHQGFEYEDATRFGRLDRTVVAHALVQRQPEQAAVFGGRDLAALRVPFRVLVAALEQVRADGFQPLDLDRGIDAREQLRGLHQLRAHDPGRRLLGDAGARKDPELAAARTQIFAGLELAAAQALCRLLVADVVDQSGQQGLMQRRVQLIRCQLRFAQLAVERVRHLAEHLVPFEHACERQEVRAAGAPQIAIRQFLAPLPPALPQLQQRQKVRAQVPPFRMLLARGLALVRRHFVGVLHRQCRGQHRDFAWTRCVAAGDGDARNPRVQRQPRQFLALPGDAALAGLALHRAEQLQQAIAFGHVSGGRRIDPREILDRAEPQRLHLQDHAGQVGAQDFGVGEQLALGEVFLGVEPQTDAGADAAAAAGALIGRGLADRLDMQLLHAEPRGIAVDARSAGIHHVANTGHRDRGFGDVGGQHDARRPAGGKHAVLLRRRQARVQRQHLRVRKALRQQARAVVDFAFARQEHQYVPVRSRSPQRFDAACDLVFEILVLPGFAKAQLHRKAAAGYGDDRRAAEVRGQPFRIQCGRGDEDLQFRTALTDLRQPAQQEVDVEAAFVGLVDDERVVGFQPAVARQLRQQDAVGHQLDQGLLAHPFVEAGFKTDESADWHFQFFGDAPGQRAGRQPPRLGMADQPAPPAAGFEQQLGQLCGLAGTGLAADHQHGMLADRLQQFVARPCDRQRLRVMDVSWQQTAAAFGAPLRHFEIASQPSLVDALTAAGTLQQLREARGVAQHQLRRKQTQAVGELGAGRHRYRDGCKTEPAIVRSRVRRFQRQRKVSGRVHGGADTVRRVLPPAYHERRQAGNPPIR